MSSSTTSKSEPSYTQLKTNNLPWYTENIGAQLTPEVSESHRQPTISFFANQIKMRKRLETYSNIAPNQVEPHIHQIRKKLWEIRAYPCTGVFAFLVPWLQYHSSFDAVVSSLTKGPDKKLLDVGSYIGHDLRALHWVGVPLSCLHGLDIISFADIGWEFFNDHDKFNIDNQLLVGDILDFDSDSQAAKAFDGKMDVVWCSAVLHQFPWPTSVLACKRLVRFSKGAGSVIIGAQLGKTEGEGKLDLKILEEMTEDTKPFVHTASSFERMWAQVGEELGVQLQVKAVWKEWVDFGCEPERCKIMGSDTGVLDWTVTLS